MLIFYLLCYAAVLPIMLNIMLTLFHSADHFMHLLKLIANCIWFTAIANHRAFAM